MNLKKIIIPLCLIVAICLTTVTSAFAEQNENGTVFTKAAPESVIQYAEDESVQLLGEYLSSNRAIGKEHFTLGNPINIQEYASDNRIYHFPVMKNGEIFAILSVYDDNGNFSSQIEENMMAEQLHKMQISDELHDVLFISADDGFYAVNGTKVIPLTPDSNAEMTERETFIHGKNKLKKINICNAIFTIDLNKKTSRQNILTETITSKVLGVKSVPQTDDGTFTGEQKNWCGAAVTAAIINYKKGTSLTAKKVTIEALGSAKDKGITNDDVISVAKKHNLFPKSGDPLSYASVKKQII